MSDWPTYDRATIPEQAEHCLRCKELGLELHRAHEKLRETRTHVSILQGLPPKGTNAVVDKLRREVSGLQSACAKYHDQMVAVHRKVTELRDTVARVKRERDDLRLWVEAHKPHPAPGGDGKGEG